MDAIGHDFGAWEPLNAGEHIRYCANDANHQETAAHRWDEGEYSDGYSCTDGGTLTHTCLDCGYQNVEVIAAGSAHHFGEWVVIKSGSDDHQELQRRECTECGAIQERTVAFTGVDPNKDPQLTTKFNLFDYLKAFFMKIINFFRSMKF